MISALYGAILGLLICWLALKVVSVRRKHKVLYADGGIAELQIARTAHSNATEYIPISLLLLLILEYSTAYGVLVHFMGVCIVAGRIIHCWGILTETLRLRALGMQFTLFSIIALSVINIIYFLYGQFFF
jgi:uncharacterized protein